MVLDMAGEGLGDRVAVGSLDHGISYAELRGASAAPMEASGGSGVLAVVEPNGPVIPLAMFSAAWRGHSYAPLNYRLPPSSVRELVAQLGPDLVVCSRRFAESLDRSQSVVEAARFLSARRAEAKAAVQAFEDEPKRPAVLLFTSGPSSTPKAAVLVHDHLVSYVLNTTEFASAGADEAVLLAAPPFHVAGVVGVLTACYAGRRIVPLPSFSAASWLELARQERVTNAFVVPTMLARIVAVMESDTSARVPTLRPLTYGGSRMPLPVLEKALDLFPNAGFVNAYGLTETSSTVSMLGPDDHREAASSSDPQARRRLESVGRPIPGVEVMIRSEDGTALPEGQLGEICLRGPQVSGRYLSH